MSFEEPLPNWSTLLFAICIAVVASAIAWCGIVYGVIDQEIIFIIGFKGGTTILNPVCEGPLAIVVGLSLSVVVAPLFLYVAFILFKDWKSKLK